MDVPLAGGGNEEVLLAGSELQAPGGRGEAPEGDGEVHEGGAGLLVADGHDPGPGAGHAAPLELLPVHAVDDVLLRAVPGTDQVQLVVLPRQVALVHRDCDGPAHGAGSGGVPVHVPHLTGPRHQGYRGQHQGQGERGRGCHLTTDNQRVFA